MSGTARTRMPVMMAIIAITILFERIFILTSIVRMSASVTFGEVIVNKTAKSVIRIILYI